MISGNRDYPGNGYLCSLHSASLYKNAASVLSILIRSLQECSQCDREDSDEGWSLGAAVRPQRFQPALLVARRGRTPPSEHVLLAQLPVSSYQAYCRCQTCLEGLLLPHTQ